MSVSEVRRRFERLSECSGWSRELRRRERLAMLSPAQRFRLDEHMRTNACLNYEDLLDDKAEPLPHDIWRALYNDTIIAETDDEKSAVIKYQAFCEALL